MKVEKLHIILGVLALVLAASYLFVQYEIQNS
jgi:hypothetical protein